MTEKEKAQAKFEECIVFMDEIVQIIKVSLETGVVSEVPAIDLIQEAVECLAFQINNPDATEEEIVEALFKGNKELEDAKNLLSQEDEAVKTKDGKMIPVKSNNNKKNIVH